MGFKAARGCISVVIAVERCICVARHFSIDSLMYSCAMVRLLAAIGVGTQRAQVFQTLAYTAGRVQDGASGQIHWNIMTTKLYADNKMVFDFILIVLLSFIIPFFSFVVESITTPITVIKVIWREENSMTLHP